MLLRTLVVLILVYTGQVDAVTLDDETIPANSDERGIELYDMHLPQQKQLDKMTKLLDDIQKLTGNGNKEVDNRWPEQLDMKGLNLDAFSHNPAGVNILSDFENPSELTKMFRVLNKLDKKNPDINLIVVRALEKRYGSLRAAQVLEILYHQKPYRKNVEKLQNMQLLEWIKNPEDVAKNLNLKPETIEIIATWKLSVLDKYIKLRNTARDGHDTLVTLLSEIYSRARLLQILVKMQTERPTRECTRWATTIQNEILREWQSNSHQMNQDLAVSTLETTFKVLMTSDPTLVTGLYQASHGKLTSLIEILESHYNYSEVMAKFFALKGRNERAKLLLKQEITRLVESGMTADNVVLKVDFESAMLSQQNINLNNAELRKMVKAEQNIRNPKKRESRVNVEEKEAKKLRVAMAHDH